MIRTLPLSRPSSDPKIGRAPTLPERRSRAEEEPVPAGLPAGEVETRALGEG